MKKPLNSPLDPNLDPDLGPDPNEVAELEDISTLERNKALDRVLLKPSEAIAGIALRPISAGDLAILMDSGVGVMMGRTDSIASDVAMILWAQSTPREEVRRLFSDKAAFRNAALDFMDGFEAGVYNEATPRVLRLIEEMNSARTSVKGESGKSRGSASPKAGGRAG